MGWAARWGEAPPRDSLRPLPAAGLQSPLEHGGQGAWLPATGVGRLSYAASPSWRAQPAFGAKKGGKGLMAAVPGIGMILGEAVWPGESYWAPGALAPPP